MATVAEQLRTAREARRLSVQQVADTTKMRADHVEALEEGNYDVFTAPVYIRGFVRTCARLLKIDEASILETLDAELAQTEKYREHPSLIGQQKGPLDALMLILSRIRWRIVLPALGVLLILGIVLTIVRSIEEQQARDPLAGIQPGQYQPARSNLAETLALPNPGAARAPSGAR